ncbi:MAG TPA: hypothetical protein VH601_20435 [Bryobacteraceae bacterium]|jgi:phage-related protein
MATFPLLASGAVTQYPVPQTSGQAVQVIRFLDGSDQRYLTQGRILRQWQIRLSLLTDRELEQIETFFSAQQGDYASFQFPDPISGTIVPNCRFGTPSLVTEYAGIDKGLTSFWVIETNG